MVFRPERVKLDATTGIGGPEPTVAPGKIPSIFRTAAEAAIEGRSIGGEVRIAEDPVENAA